MNKHRLNYRFVTFLSGFIFSMLVIVMSMDIAYIAYGRELALPPIFVTVGEYITDIFLLTGFNPAWYIRFPVEFAAFFLLSGIVCIVAQLIAHIIMPLYRHLTLDNPNKTVKEQLKYCTKIDDKIYTFSNIYTAICTFALLVGLLWQFWVKIFSGNIPGYIVGLIIGAIFIGFLSFFCFYFVNLFLMEKIGNICLLIYFSGLTNKILAFPDAAFDLADIFNSYYLSHRRNKIYLRLAEKGNAEGQYRMYKLSNNTRERNEWLEKAAAQGHTEALQELAVNLYKGSHGFEQDLPQAFALFKQIAPQGSAEMQYLLGKCYSLGKGVETDKAEAFRWFQKAAEQGHINAKHEIAYSYRYGYGVPKDTNKAIELYKELAEADDGSAMLSLGEIYDYGGGDNKNLAKYWYKKAAEKGYDSANERLNAFWRAENPESAAAVDAVVFAEMMRRIKNRKAGRDPDDDGNTSQYDGWWNGMAGPPSGGGTGI